MTRWVAPPASTATGVPAMRVPSATVSVRLPALVSVTGKPCVPASPAVNV